MKHTRIVRNVLLFGFLAVALLASQNAALARQAGRSSFRFNAALQSQAPSSPQVGSTAFTYQGELKDSGALANGNYDFQFVLYDAADGGNQVPGTSILNKDAVVVTEGQFNVQLDFGDVFGDSQLFLQIGVKPVGSAGAYTILSPRQEITPAPYAMASDRSTYAVTAGSADSVAWENISNKPQAQLLRKIYVTGGAFGHPATANFVDNQWGLQVVNSSQYAGFVTPAPSDWDVTTPFTVTLYFALPNVAAESVVNWRMWAGGSEFNLGQGGSSTGWDSLSYGPQVNGTPLTVYPSGAYNNVMKAQSWVPQWSNEFNTWYFGAGVTTANAFNRNPIWRFAFTRGASVGNGETFTGDIIIVGAEITYQTVP